MTFSNPIVGGTTLIRPAIHSPNYIPGVDGWSVNKDGSAEFNDVVIRGSAQSTNYVAGVSGWKLDQDGDAEFNSIQIRSTGTETPITVGADTEPQVKIASNASHGAISFPTNRTLENLIAGILSTTGNSGLANEYESLQIYGPTVDGAGDRSFILLNSQNNDGSSQANASVTTGSSALILDENTATFSGHSNVNITGSVNVDGSLDVDGSVVAGNLQFGTATANFSAVTQVDVAVVFPQAFLTTPVVTCSRQNSPANSAKVMVNATGISTTGFTMRFNTGDGTAVTISSLVGGYIAMAS